VRERLRAAGTEDLAAWEKVRALLQDAVGESTFEIWLEQLELVAVDLEGTLVVSAPAETVGWVVGRFGRVFDRAAQQAGRGLRLADEVERRAAEPLTPAGAAARAARASMSADGRSPRGVCVAGRPADVPPVLSEVVLSDMPAAGRADQSPRKPTYTSDFPSSFTDVYTHTREVS
jgi:hypothetical protein